MSPENIMELTEMEADLVEGTNSAEMPDSVRAST
jgi:hypothetical protein